jgi:beta-lactamase regulating signal transducer with metallopeptidase domain
MTGALANHLWQSTLFAVLAGALAAALRENRAHVRYWVWFLASFKFLVPFSVLMGLGGRLASSLAVNEVAAPGVPAFSFAIRQVAQPFSEMLSSAYTDQTGQNWPAAMLLGVWVCGAMALALTRLRDWRMIRAAADAGVPMTSPSAELRTSGVEIRSTPGLTEPGVVGVWRPILMVPANVQDNLPPSQLEAVLAHELWHVHRRDNLSAAIHMIVETVFWFHPLVWWIGTRLVEERERACDEHVLRILGDPEAYAHGILNVCRLYAESPLACVSGTTGSNLKKRIEDIMGNRIGVRLSLAKRTALGMAAAMALVVPVVAGFMTAPIQAQSQDRGGVGSEQPVTTKEAALKNALFQIRQAIDRYHADLKKYPRRLDVLVSGGYLKRIPTDPFTRRSDSWRTVPSKPDTNSPSGGDGIFDVRSGSRATASDGTKYANW